MSNLANESSVQTSARPPMMGVSNNPLLHLQHSDLRPVPAGVSIASLRPETKGKLRCYVNGVALYPITTRQWQHHVRLLGVGREDDARRYLARSMRRALNWQRTITRPGDVIAWHEVLEDKDTLRTVLLIAAVVVAWWNPGNYGALLAFGIQAASAIFLPPTNPQQDAQAQGGSVYSTSLTGNQARLDQPIWRNCGLTKITPPLAGQMHYEYIDPDDDGLDADQYLRVPYAIGTGKNDVVRTFIGKTPIDHYQDIKLANYLPPGTQPTQVLCNVLTSTEVTGIELDSGRFAGGYVASQPDRTCASFGLDFAASQGLGTATGGEVTVSWRVEVREIDRFGRPISTWRIVASESRTAATNTPQRWSYKYPLITPARIEVRVARTDVKDTSPGTRSSLQWIGLRGYLEQPAPLNADTAHYELVIRASEQLGAQSQRDVSMLVQAYARTWHPDTGWSCALGDYDSYTATRNPAWYLGDLLADPVWGLGLPDERIDLQGLYDWAQTCDARQDRFDYTFDGSMNAWDAAQLIARAGRARVFRRFGVVTLARDELVTLPVTAFSPRNTVPDSMTSAEKLPTREVADGVIVEYTSNITWDIATIECPCPGFTVTDETDPRYNPALPKMTRPVFQRLEGIKGATHAEREGLYEAARMMLRTRSVNCTTEMEGVAVCFADPIRWQPEVGGFGQSGDVAFWNLATLTMGLTEPIDWAGSDTTYLTLMRDDGSLTTAVAVIPGPTPYDVVLPAAPDFELVLDDARRERPKFFIGHLDQLVRVTSITDGGKTEAEEGQEGAQLYSIAGFVDDERVHQADVHLLPGPGDVQDPVDTSALPPDNMLLVHLTDHNAYDPGAVALPPPAPTGQILGHVGLDARAEYTLTNDGHGYARTMYAPFGAGTVTPFASEWVYGSTIDTTTAALYEVRATYKPGLPPDFAFISTGTVVDAPPNFGDPVDVWLSLDTTRTWGQHGEYIGCVLLIEIREVANPSVIQTYGTVVLANYDRTVPH